VALFAPEIHGGDRTRHSPNARFPVSFHLLLLAALSVAVSVVVAVVARARYTRAVSSNMGRQGETVPVEAPTPSAPVGVVQGPATPGPAAEDLRFAVGSQAALDLVGGLAWGVLVGMCLETWAWPGPADLSHVGGWVTVAGPAVLSCLTVGGASRRARLFALGGLAVTAVAVGVAASLVMPVKLDWAVEGSLIGVILLQGVAIPLVWLVGTTAAPALFAASLDNGWLRPFGVLALCSVGPATVALGAAVMLAPDDLLQAGALGVVAVVAGLTALPLLAWAQKRELLTTGELERDVWWGLMGAAVLCLIQVTGELTLGAVGAVVCATVVRKSLPRFLRWILSPPPVNRRLLLLRVFDTGLGSDVYRMLRDSWAHVGQVVFISGLDLAHRSVDPIELWAWVRGRMGDVAVAGPQDLQRRLTDLDLPPGVDQRFQAAEFFCADESWRGVMETLAVRSSAALMDLRGMGAENAGCRWELDHLFVHMRPDQVVLLVDDTTDMPVLREHLTHAVAQHAGDVRILHAPDHALILHACAAAAEHDPEPEATRERPVRLLRTLISAPLTFVCVCVAIWLVVQA
jgi:hypothetical protein